MRLIPASVVAVFVFACVTPRMNVPPELARDGELLEATDRTNVSGGLFDENFRLGPYAITDVHRLGNSSEHFEVALGDTDDGGGYEFNLVQAGTALRGNCRSAPSKRFACTCASTSATATLSMRDQAGTFEGSVTTSSGRYRVTSVHELEGGSNQNEPSGYRIDANGLVGAADVMSPGRVWLKKTVAETERHELVCLFVGLMLFEAPEAPGE
jgi:hypothetical protein